MGILSRLRKKRDIKNLSVTDEKAWNPSLWNLYGSQSLSGESVTEANALTQSAIWNAVTLYSGTISTLPLHLLRKDDNKTLMVEEKKLFQTLYGQFNPYMTAQIGREVMMAHVLLWGNAYAEIVRNGYGEITELWPIAPNRVKPEMQDGKLVYVIQVDNEEVTLQHSRILHIPGLGFDGFQGYSVVGMARKSFGLGAALESFGALYFGNGTHPGLVVSHPDSLSEQANKNLTESLTKKHAGLGKTHKLLLLEEGMSVEKIGIPPEDSQFLESRQFHIAEVARWFNLPPHKLKDLSRSSFSNIESEQISFVTDSVLPWLIRLEQQYNMQLLSANEKFKQKMYFRHNVDGLLRGSAKDRSEYYRVMFGIGALSINEIRAKENRDPVENGDERFIPLNMLPLSQIDKYLEYQKPTKTTEVQEKPMDLSRAHTIIKEDHK